MAMPMNGFRLGARAAAGGARAAGRNERRPMLLLVATLLALPVAAACHDAEPVAKVRPTFHMGPLEVSASLPAEPVPQLGPVPLQLTWRPGPGFVAPRDSIMVFLQFIDSDGRLIFSRDHTPSPEAAQWQSGKPVDYRYFARVPTVAPDRYEIRAGLYEPLAQSFRVTFVPEVGGDAVDYVTLGTFEVTWRDPTREPLYLQGWAPLEVNVDDIWGMWRWTLGDAAIELPRAGGGQVMHMWIEAPDATPEHPQRLSVEAGGETIATRTVMDRAPFHWQMTVDAPCAADCRGTVWLRPSRLLRDESRGADPRRLAVKVLGIYLEPARR